MDSQDEIETVRVRVENILSRLMRVEVHVNQGDPRIASIYNEIKKHNGRNITDEEMTEYVRKYFRFKAVLGVNSS